MNFIYTFRYAGTKYPFLETIINLLLSINNRTHLIEPFGGSGVVSVNASKFFDEVHLNDLCRELMCIHKMFKESCWKDHQLFNKNYPNFQYIARKKYYYECRNLLNAYWWKSNNINEGIALYYIAGACINSMFRVGPNGFNQGAANQNLSKQMNPCLLMLLKRAYENINLTTKDAYELFDEYATDENATWFIDPPYNNTTLDYGKHCPKMELIEKMLQLKGNVIYTDSFNESQDKIMKDAGFQSIILRDNMPNISVGGKGEQYQDRIEILYHNINSQQK